MRMVMHGHWLSAGLSVPGRIGVIAVDAAGESHSSSLQKCKRNHDCDRAANNHQTILKPSLSNVQPSPVMTQSRFVRRKQRE